MVGRDKPVKLLENGDESLYERGSSLKDQTAVRFHLLFPDVEYGAVGLRFSFQQRVALNQGFVVADQGIQVPFVRLRNHQIDKSASLFAAARD